MGTTISHVKVAAGADVNYDNGVYFVKAAAKGNIRVLEQLFKHGPSREHMTLAFPQIFASGVDSPTLTDLIDILKYLIKARCPADPPVETSRGAYASLLCWALGEDTNRISDDIADVLLGAGGEYRCPADANYKTPSGQTPLEIAISTSRRKAVASLIHHGADPTVLSGITSPKSLLHLAVTTENRAIIQLIVLACPMAHDGALHYTAREVNVPILEILTTEGSQRDYTYSGCEGRTALAELCLKGDGTKPRHKLARAMRLLTKRHRPNFKKKSNGKSALHLALDNHHKGIPARMIAC
ncbi:ankyrin repeat-containing domain protein [Aspergillus unguis]